MSSNIFQRIDRARKILEEGDEFRILTHYDVDGVCSAGIIANYLSKRDKRFHISFFRNVDKEEILSIIKNEEYVIVTDMGASFATQIGGNVIILDHHKPQGDNEKIVYINPHLFGYDGSHDACASTLAYMLTEDRSMAKFFLAGVFGDKQHLGGFTGLNKDLFEKLGIKLTKNIALYGNVLNAILYSTEPFFPGLSGRRDNVEKMLRELGIPLTKEIENLSEEEKIKLTSLLSLNLIKHSEIPNAAKLVVDFDVVMEESVRYLAELIDSASRTDNQSIALSYILGSSEAKDRMELLRREYKSEVIEGVYDMLENLFQMDHIQYFFVKNSYLTGSISTIAALYLLNPEKAILALYVDENVHISARSSKELAKKVHLGDILRKVASKFDGEGGGHNIAAGATIPKGAEEEFLKEVDREIGKILSS